MHKRRHPVTRANMKPGFWDVVDGYPEFLQCAYNVVGVIAFGMTLHSLYCRSTYVVSRFVHARTANTAFYDPDEIKCARRAVSLPSHPEMSLFNSSIRTIFTVQDNNLVILLGVWGENCSRTLALLPEYPAGENVFTPRMDLTKLLTAGSLPTPYLSY